MMNLKIKMINNHSKYNKQMKIFKMKKNNNNKLK